MYYNNDKTIIYLNGEFVKEAMQEATYFGQLLHYFCLCSV